MTASKVIDSLNKQLNESTQLSSITFNIRTQNIQVLCISFEKIDGAFLDCNLCYIQLTSIHLTYTLHSCHSFGGKQNVKNTVNKNKPSVQCFSSVSWPASPLLLKSNRLNVQMANGINDYAKRLGVYDEKAIE